MYKCLLNTLHEKYLVYRRHNILISSRKITRKSNLTNTWNALHFMAQILNSKSKGCSEDYVFVHCSISLIQWFSPLESKLVTISALLGQLYLFGQWASGDDDTQSGCISDGTHYEMASSLWFIPPILWGKFSGKANCHVSSSWGWQAGPVLAFQAP